jgi:hypothetical protein
MRIPLEQILKRLVLLGLPLAPVGCGSSPVATADGSGGLDSQVVCMSTHEASNTISVTRPPQDSDGGADNRVTIAAWDSCASGGDCTALCMAFEAGFNPVLHACDRVAPVDGGDASGGDSDAGDEGGVTEPVIEIQFAYTFTDCTGRRCQGFRRRQPAQRGTDVGRWLADVAALEAASVPAFRRLGAELEAHRAPPALIQSARRAAREEARHFQMVARAARARGAMVEPPRGGQQTIRSLSAMAAENAREGCVRETFGAATAAYQARHAADLEIRALMRQIAGDEARHAQLAWQVDDWAGSRLSPRQARRVSEAKRKAAGALRAQLLTSAAPAPALAAALGLPDATASRALVARAHALLWS